jgi:hypothetical protein
MAGEERGEASPSACMQVSRFVLARRSSHLRHVFVTLAILMQPRGKFPVMP